MSKKTLHHSYVVVIAVACLLLTLVSITATAQNKGNTRLLRFPDIHADSVAFTFAGDLWLASRSGGQARRLTAHPGAEVFAKFSPDGKWIAFTGDYDGNTDVYVMPAEGGEPRRLTYHPQPDQVLTWTPDGRRILFRSPRTSFTARFDKLFTVGLNGGMPEELPLPAAGLTSYSPDGTKIAYNRISSEFRPNYLEMPWGLSCDFVDRFALLRHSEGARFIHFVPSGRFSAKLPRVLCQKPTSTSSSASMIAWRALPSPARP